MSQKSYGLCDLESAVLDEQKQNTSVSDGGAEKDSVSDPAPAKPQLYSGFREIHKALNAEVNQPGCHAIAIRDYYPFWKHHNERSHAGKLLLHDPCDDTVMPMFFDDNIGEARQQGANDYYGPSLFGLFSTNEPW